MGVAFYNYSNVHTEPIPSRFRVIRKISKCDNITSK